jgi:hypothetical protein
MVTTKQILQRIVVVQVCSLESVVLKEDPVSVGRRLVFLVGVAAVVLALFIGRQEVDFGLIVVRILTISISCFVELVQPQSEFYYITYLWL